MDNYEFNEQQNTQLAKLATSMTFVGVMMIVLGVICGLSVLAGEVSGVITGVLYVLIGVWTRSAGQSLRSIVDTEGNDISHLMDAIGNLGKLYLLQKWLVILAIIALAIAFFVGMTMVQ
jgi:hypothetical protein